MAAPLVIERMPDSEVEQFTVLLMAIDRKDLLDRWEALCDKIEEEKTTPLDFLNELHTLMCEVTTALGGDPNEVCEPILAEAMEAFFGGAAAN